MIDVGSLAATDYIDSYGAAGITKRQASAPELLGQESIGLGADQFRPLNLPEVNPRDVEKLTRGLAEQPNQRLLIAAVANSL
jgi:hypothetical protein